VYADPYEGGKQAVAEAYRNLCAVGAKPLAITNCLNFGNPQRPEIMAQFVEALRGMGDACRALDFPIVSGNVSLYNESKATGGGSAILPTPAIGGVGLLEDWEKSATIGFKAEGDQIALLYGGSGTEHFGDDLSQSLWLREILGRKEGSPPYVDLEAERCRGEFIRELIAKGQVNAVHDLSDGGMLVGLAEMALAGNIGANVDFFPSAENAFGEEQARYLIAGPDLDSIAAIGHPVMMLGTVGGSSLKGRTFEVSLADLRAAHEGFFPRLMGADAALA
jgi:phosphoribosylformylglycinamidine synthase